MPTIKNAHERSAPRRGILSQLARDKSGNTLAMFCAALIPVIGMTGSAVDIGRAYLVKTRLQQACDAGVLAGRKAMTGGNFSGDSGAQTAAQNFFRANMKNGLADARNVTFTPVGVNSSEIVGTASADVPTSLMQIFGQTNIDLTVRCGARLEIPNTDVIMVLDVTGSMYQCANNDNPGSNGCTTSNNKIAVMRQAVLDFYDTVRAATGVNTRFRIGFVPYSQNVNVGIGFGETNGVMTNSSWVVTNWTYQSRVANMTTPGWTATPTVTFGAWNNESITSVTNSQCTTYGSNGSISGRYTPAAGTDPNVTNSNANNAQAPATTYQASQPTDQRRIYERVTAAWGSGSRTCTRRYRIATTSYTSNGRFGFTNWTYKPVSYDVSTYRDGTPVNVYVANTTPTGSVSVSGEYNMVDLVNSPNSNVTGVSSVFDGCYEERDTVASSTFTALAGGGYSPSGAFDMDFTTVPSSDATRWRPAWNELVYDRSGATETTTTSRSPLGTTCPAEAVRLEDRTRSDVETYVNSLQPVGATWHDLGMAWGLRFVSQSGIYAADNATAPNGQQISRHILFLTDGDMNANPTQYGSHGYEMLDRRTFGTSGTPNSTAMNNIHNSRFVAMCNAARVNGISVWTVAFGTSNPTTLTQCANTDQDFTATDGAALRQAFQDIASRIAQLRLSQ